MPEWAFGMNCAVTVVDTDCRIIYMNDRSRQTFAKRGGADLIGHNILDYHNERSQGIIRRLLAEGGSNLSDHLASRGWHARRTRGAFYDHP